MNKANGYISVNRHRAYAACILFVRVAEYGIYQQAEKFFNDQAVSKRKGLLSSLFPRVARTITKETAYEMARQTHIIMSRQSEEIAKLGIAISSSDEENVLLDVDTVYFLYKYGKLDMSPSFEEETLPDEEVQDEFEHYQK